MLIMVWQTSRQYEVNKLIVRKKNAVYLGGKRLGVIYPSKKTFRSFRRSSKHLFKAYSGWGVNRELLEYLERMGIEWVEIEDKDTNTIYRTTVKTIDEKGIIYDNDGETQKILPLPYWSRRVMFTSLDNFMGG